MKIGGDMLSGSCYRGSTVLSNKFSGQKSKLSWSSKFTYATTWTNLCDNNTIFNLINLG